MKVSVIGAGVMGPGIVQSWLQAGYRIDLCDIDEKALSRARASIRKSLALMRDKSLLEKDVDQYLSFLNTTTSLEKAVEGAQLVIEAVSENPQVKEKVYSQLDKYCAKDTIIVSNTSSLPLPDMFPHFRPDKFFICHYFNPPEIIPLVELVKNEQTDEKAVDWLKEKLEACGKKPIVLNGYKMGFLVNRLQIAMIREALALVSAGIVKPEDVDTAVKVGIGFKQAWQGLFDTMDYIGLDTVAMAYNFICQDLYSGTDIPAIIADKIEKGELGVKTGRGFFDYSDEASQKALEKRTKVLLEQLILWKKAMADKVD